MCTNKQQQQQHDNCLFSMKQRTASLFLLTSSMMICGGLAQDRNATTGALSLPNPKVILFNNNNHSCVICVVLMLGSPIKSINWALFKCWMFVGSMWISNQNLPKLFLPSPSLPHTCRLLLRREYAEDVFLSPILEIVIGDFPLIDWSSFKYTHPEKKKPV